MDRDIDNVILDDIAEERAELDAKYLQQRRRGRKRKDDRLEKGTRQAKSGSPLRSASASPSKRRLEEGQPLPNPRKDAASILLLLVLYTLQGIPMGLSGSVPFLLQEKVSYKDQAMFSLVTWPFSLKLLWAPLVDSLYSKSFGRRKSWLVPVQLLCAGLMLYVSGFIEGLMGAGRGSDAGDVPDVKTLTIIFFILYALMATQDIAVDGWALTMLSKENVGYASTCNSVGQTLGYFVSYVGFLGLNDVKICNRLFRSEPSNEPIVTLAGFMQFWGWVFLITTLVVWILKRELPESEEDELSLSETYFMLWKVIKLKSVRQLCAILITYQVGFAAADSITSLKLVEYGLPKEELALMAPLLIPIGIVLPVIVGRWVNGPQPLTHFMRGYPPRLVVGLLYAFMVWYTPIGMAAGSLPFSFYLLVLSAAILHEITATFHFCAKLAFFAKVSDPAIGGSYMTLLNTISNLGSKWPNSLSLYLVEWLTVKECRSASFEGDILSMSDCSSAEQIALCKANEGSCVTVRDGYFVEIALCTLLGLLWMFIAWRPMIRVQDLPSTHWQTGYGAASFKAT